MRNNVECDAIDFVIAYYTPRGFTVTNVARARGEHKGYDLVIAKDGATSTVEVKGCSRPYRIPDPYYSEFDPETKRLIADLLCVVYFWPERSPELAIIPRDEIPPELVHPKVTYRISGNLRTRRQSENSSLMLIDALCHSGITTSTELKGDSAVLQTFSSASPRSLCRD